MRKVSDLDKLKTKLIQDQKALLAQKHIRTGNLLYAIAAIQTRLDATPGEEQPQLRAFLATLDASYRNILNPKGVKERLTALLLAGNAWLNASRRDASAETKVLYQSLYAVLTTIGNDIEAAKKTWAGSAAFRLIGIDIDETLGEIRGDEDTERTGLLPQLEDALTSTPQQREAEAIEKNEAPEPTFLADDVEKLDIIT